MHHIFDDYEVKEVLKNYQSYGISEKKYEILAVFCQILNVYADNKMDWFNTINPNELLADPEWHKIQLMAKNVLQAFEFKT